MFALLLYYQLCLCLMHGHGVPDDQFDETSEGEWIGVCSGMVDWKKREMGTV